MIEHCKDCREHGFQTRHDLQKYLRFADEMQKSLGGPTKCLKNQIPASWRNLPSIKANLKIEKGSYSDETDTYAINPRLGAFEVFINIGLPQGSARIVQLFSKHHGGIWPRIPTVADRAQ